MALNQEKPAFLAITSLTDSLKASQTKSTGKPCLSPSLNPTVLPGGDTVNLWCWVLLAFG